MSEPAQLALIAMIGSILTGLIAAIPAYLAYKKAAEAATTARGAVATATANNDEIRSLAGTVAGADLKGAVDALAAALSRVGDPKPPDPDPLRDRIAGLDESLAQIRRDHA